MDNNKYSKKYAHDNQDELSKRVLYFSQRLQNYLE